MSALEIPKNIGEQLNLLAPYNPGTPLTHDLLHLGLLELAKQAKIPLVSSFCRTKDRQRLREKIERSGWQDPIADIHAARLILKKSDFPILTKAIFKEWPSPEFYQYSWGDLYSFRDYSDPNTKQSFNADSDPSYQATHLTILVPFGAKLAEVQLYTVNDFYTYFKTKAAYQNRQRQRLQSKSTHRLPYALQILLEYRFYRDFSTSICLSVTLD